MVGPLSKCPKISLGICDPKDYAMAAQNGNFSICQFMVNNLTNANPGDESRFTPLHHAAENGHFEICRLIIDNIEDKNPKNQWGFTPLHKAAQNGHLAICKLILENTTERNPEAVGGWTPLRLANCNDHFEICKLIDNTFDMNPEWKPLKYERANYNKPVRRGIKRNFSSCG